MHPCLAGYRGDNQRDCWTEEGRLPVDARRSRSRPLHPMVPRRVRGDHGDAARLRSDPRQARDRPRRPRAAYFELAEGTTRLRESIDERWGEAAPRTRKNVRAVTLALLRPRVRARTARDSSTFTASPVRSRGSGRGPRAVLVTRLLEFACARMSVCARRPRRTTRIPVRFGSVTTSSRVPRGVGSSYEARLIACRGSYHSEKRGATHRGTGRTRGCDPAHALRR